MLSIHRTQLKRNIPLWGWQILLIILVILLNSCSYRLTNLYLEAPNKIKTIAVEAVYDTSGQVVPHELIWTELQKAFAANGHLKVVAADQADALLRAHLHTFRSSNSGPRGSNGTPIAKGDPELYGEIGPPIAPGTLRDLTTARDYYSKETKGLVLDVEIWDLKRQTLILQRSYSGGFDVLATRAPSDSPADLLTVRKDESSDKGVTKVAKLIAETVVSDFLVK